MQEAKEPQALYRDALSSMSEMDSIVAKLGGKTNPVKPLFKCLEDFVLCPSRFTDDSVDDQDMLQVVSNCCEQFDVCSGTVKKGSVNEVANSVKELCNTANVVVVNVENRFREPEQDGSARFLVHFYSKTSPRRHIMQISFQVDGSVVESDSRYYKAYQDAVTLVAAGRAKHGIADL